MDEKAGRARPLLLGHRGQRHTRRQIIRALQQQVIPPDNTLAAFELTMQRGCDGFEFDVRYTNDRRGVICHDPDISGLPVANSHYEELVEAYVQRDRREHIDPDEQMPCLEDVLLRFSHRAFLDIEVKIPGYEHEVAAAIRKHPPQKGYVISSFLAPVLRTFYDIEPNLQLGFICNDRRLLPEWRTLPVGTVIPHTKLVSDAFIQELHAAGKRVFVWTVNRESEMRRLALWRVDGIISDDTELLVKVFTRKRRP